MKNRFLILLFALFAFGGTACESLFEGQILEIELPEHTPILTPYCFVNDQDSTITVIVQQSEGALENTETKYIENATIELYKNGTLLGEIPKLTTDFYYQWRMEQPFSEEGYGDEYEYELRVSAEGFETTTGTQIMPSPVPIVSADYKPNSLADEFGEPLDGIDVTFDDNGEEANFYAIEVFAFYEWSSVLEGDTIYEKMWLVNANTDPSITDGFRAILISDKLFNGQRYTAKIGTYGFGFNGEENPGVLKIKPVLLSITEDEYYYRKSLQDYQSGQESLFPEPALIHTNMSAGLGVFSMMASSEYVLDL